MAKLIKADGATTEVKPDGSSFTLEELRSLVGGFVEPYRLSPRKYMLADEDGKLKKLPLNTIASKILSAATGHFVVVVGDVLIVTKKEMGS